MMKTAMVLVVLLSGCATINTPVGQIPLPTEPMTREVMRAPNAAWNCYVSPDRCFRRGGVQ